MKSFTGYYRNINKNIELPSPPPAAPGVLRCSGDDFISCLFLQTGLKNISQKEVAEN
jgi:hypothetical protein